MNVENAQMNVQKQGKKHQGDEGFSSQDEIEPIKHPGTAVIEDVFQLTDEQQEKYRKRMQKALEPAAQIKVKQYSLEPDMATGWKPRFFIATPIPLTFEDEELDEAVNDYIMKRTYEHQNKSQKVEESVGSFFTEQKNTPLNPFPSQLQLIYLGPRYQSTYSSWYQKPFPFPYTHLNTNKRLKFTDRQFVGQYWHAETEEHLRFDSFFESGNLDVVFKVPYDEYHLWMRVDSNTRGHLQWYNFKVRNMKKGRVYKFHISNFSKGKSLYSRGMKPYIHSTKRKQNEKIGWAQGGTNVTYEKKHSILFRNMPLKRRKDPKTYCLSFDYECMYEGDEVQFAYCVPYQYSKMISFLEEMQRQSAGHNFFRFSKLKKSLGGLQIPFVTITKDLQERQQQKKQEEESSSEADQTQNMKLNLKLKFDGIDKQFEHKNRKKMIFIGGRIHPGESNGSHVLQGLIRFLCDKESEEASKLRENIVFKIIPIINPDGVVIGNYRSSLSGTDLNREFVEPEEAIFPEIFNLKNTVKKFKDIYKEDFLMYLDFHGHSTKKNVFSYGPQFPITNSGYYESRILPKIISSQTDMFRYFSCIFRISSEKKTTARAVLIKQLGIKLFYTIETSNGSYYNTQSMKDTVFDVEGWKKMGFFIGRSLNKYSKIVRHLQMMRLKKKIDRQNAKSKMKQKARLKSALLRKKVLDAQSIESKTGRSNISISLSRDKGKEKQKNSVIVSSKRLKRSDSEFSFDLNSSQFDNMSEFSGFGDQDIDGLLQQIYHEGKKALQKKNRIEEEGQDLQNMDQATVSMDFNSLEGQHLGDSKDRNSDDDISEGGSDSSSASQDLDKNLQRQLFGNIKEGKENKLLKDLILRSRSESCSYSCTEMSSSEKELESNKVVEQVPSESEKSIEVIKPEIKLDFVQCNTKKINDLKAKKSLFIKKRNQRIQSAMLAHRNMKKNQEHSANIINFEFSLEPINQPSIGNGSSSTSDAHLFYSEKPEGRIRSQMRRADSYYASEISAFDNNPTVRLNRSVKNGDYSESFRQTFHSVERKIKTSHQNATTASFYTALKERKRVEKGSQVTGSNFYKHLKQKRLMHIDSRRMQTEESTCDFMMASSQRQSFDFKP